jgi:hypothetical protein
MPKRNDGNEQDLRVRPFNDAPSLAGDNPFTGDIPDGKDPCTDGYGSQTDIPVTISTPDGPYNYNWADLSYVCPNGFSTRSLNRFFVALLKNHFSNADNIFRDNLKQYIYSSDPSINKIRIVMNTAWDPNSVGLLPAIVVKRGQQQPIRITIGDRGSMDSVLQGDGRYVRCVQGVHKLLCIGDVDGLTEELGQEVMDLLTCLSPAFRQDLPFHDFQVDGLSELGLMDDLGSSLATVVQCTYAYEYAWTMERVAPNLRVVKADINTTPVTE